MRHAQLHWNNTFLLHYENYVESEWCELGDDMILLSCSLHGKSLDVWVSVSRPAIPVYVCSPNFSVWWNLKWWRKKLKEFFRSHVGNNAKSFINFPNRIKEILNMCFYKLIQLSFLIKYQSRECDRWMSVYKHK